MTGEGPSVHQTTHAMVRRELRTGLREAGEQPGPGEFGSVVYRAAAALYALLLEHPVDRHGYCRSCRPVAIFGRRRRRCRIYPLAQYWLGQFRTAGLIASLAAELGLSPPPPPAPVARSGRDRPGVTGTGRAPAQPTGRGAPPDRDDTGTEMLPRIGTDPDSTPTSPRPRPSRPAPPSPGRDGRLWITAGPGSDLSAPGLTVAHPRSSTTGVGQVAAGHRGAAVTSADDTQGEDGMRWPRPAPIHRGTPHSERMRKGPRKVGNELPPHRGSSVIGRCHGTAEKSREGIPGMVPLMGRSLRFANGMFQHMTRTRDAASCRREAELARVAALSDPGQRRLAYLAQAAWWEAVADRCRDPGDGSRGISRE